MRAEASPDLMGWHNTPAAGWFLWRAVRRLTPGGFDLGKRLIPAEHWPAGWRVLASPGPPVAHLQSTRTSCDDLRRPIEGG